MEQQHSGATLGLHDYIGIVRRRWLVIVGFTLLTIAMTAVVTFRQTPTYTSSVEMLVEPIRGGSALEQAVLGRGTLSTQARLVTSVPMATEVAQLLELDTPPRELLDKVSATPVGDTTILRIEATDTDPQLAAWLAQGFADTYLSVRREQALEQLELATSELSGRIQDIRDRLRELDRQLAASDDAAAADEESSTGDPGEQTGPSPAAEDSGRTALLRERDTLLTQLGQLTAQNSTLASAGALQGGGEILVPAVAANEPTSPQPLRNLALATVLGLVLGFGLAFVRDYLDDAMRTDEQVREAMHGKPVLGHLPFVEDGGGSAPLPTLREPQSPAAEAARTLRTNLRFMTVDHDPQLASVTVTSALEGDGKTTVASNLAVAASLMGARVLLIDADLRRPNVHRTFGIDNVQGLSELLTNQIGIRDAIRDIGVRNLRLITAGTRPPNPSELLGSVAFARSVRSFQDLADLIVIDAPPVLPVSDALEVSHWTAGTLLVTRAGRSGRRTVRDATDRLEATGAHVLGSVVNGVPHGGESYYYYTYSYGYGTTAADTERETRRSRMADADLAPSGSAYRREDQLWQPDTDADAAPEHDATGSWSEPPPPSSQARPATAPARPSHADAPADAPPEAPAAVPAHPRASAPDASARAERETRDDAPAGSGRETQPEPSAQPPPGDPHAPFVGRPWSPTRD